jgi:hypothetical protein
MKDANWTINGGINRSTGGRGREIDKKGVFNSDGGTTIIIKTKTWTLCETRIASSEKREDEEKHHEEVGDTVVQLLWDWRG